MSKSSLKGYKLTNSSRSRICGVACKSLSELLEKGRNKFKFGPKDKLVLYLQDGTIVDNEEYFNTVSPQTLFILAKEREKVTTGADLIYHALRAVNIDLLKVGSQIRQFFDEDSIDKLKVIVNSLQSSKDDKLEASSILDDPDWFVGLETNLKTKELVLFRRCQDRMRGYYYKTSCDVKSSTVYKSESEARKALDALLDSMKEMLKKNQYLGFYFDRKSEGRICSPIGDFKCQGVWSREGCEFEGTGHNINPYASREQRILFSTWNLDHRIERSRTIIPTILNSASGLVKEEGCKKGSLNTDYFFKLLFTTHNLRLVHIVCHDKKGHVEAKCSDADVYRPLPLLQSA